MKNAQNITVPALLLCGMFMAQSAPSVLGEWQSVFTLLIGLLSAWTLAMIMIPVGHECDIEKKGFWSKHRIDIGVSSGSATLPWLLVSLFFHFFILQPESWWTWHGVLESALIGRFAAPTSAGILLTLLDQAGLKETWTRKKAQLVVILDDIETVILCVGLVALHSGAIGPAAIVIAISLLLLAGGWRWMGKCNLPVGWKSVAVYSLTIVAVCKSIELVSHSINSAHPLHIEPLLPAFILGFIIRRHHRSDSETTSQDDEIAVDLEQRHVPEASTTLPPSEADERAFSRIKLGFMFLVGAGMPAISLGSASSVGTVMFHVACVSVLMIAGKLVPLFAYRNQSIRQRLALCACLQPRGEVGAGIILMSLSQGISQQAVTIALLALTVNLLMTPIFIMIAKRLLEEDERRAQMPNPTPENRLFRSCASFNDSIYIQSKNTLQIVWKRLWILLGTTLSLMGSGRGSGQRPLPHSGPPQVQWPRSSAPFTAKRHAKKLARHH